MTVRVRFAPSPTGFLHIGNARAALINWLFAKKHDGEFVLRMDDTDPTRSEDKFANAIYADMKWLGLNYNETFKQSDRFDQYHAAKDKLIKMGRLYPCYETPEELDFMRKRLLARKLPPIYDRSALSLSPEHIKEYEIQGRKPHWRFKLNHDNITWDDLVRGHVEFHGSALSDPVLIREDGAFLYTITSVVDDLAAKITHIIRGEDHVSNTATQVQLFEALNDDPYDVTFGHTTLLMDHDGKALSKRLGSLSLGQMRDMGIEPMAINSLLARLGTSQSVEPVLSLSDLAKSFDLKTFSRTPPRFCEDDLKALNHKLFHIMPFEDVKDQLESMGADGITHDVWDLVKSNLETLDDAKTWQNILFEGATDFNDVTEPSDGFFKTALKHLPSDIPDAPWTPETWGIWTQNIKAETGLKGKNLFMPLRRALTGHDHGPEMKRLILHMGYNRVYMRIEKLSKI